MPLRSLKMYLHLRIPPLGLVAECTLPQQSFNAIATKSLHNPPG
jgi:hypothetical protein